MRVRERERERERERDRERDRERERERENHIQTFITVEMSYITPVTGCQRSSRIVHNLHVKMEKL